MTPGYELKFRRAADHLKEVERLLLAYMSPQPYKITPEKDPDVGLSFWITLREEPPDDISLAAGDCIHNLRSALDHVVYELSLRTAGRPVSQTGFPIFVDPEDWDRRELGRRRKFKTSSGRHKLRKVPEGARLYIESLQPYHGLDARHWRARPLLQVHQLDIADKHRNLNLAFANIPDIGVGYGFDGGPPLKVTHVHQGRLYAGTKTLLLRFHPSVDLEVHVEPTTSLDVVFSDPPVEQWEVGNALERLVNGVGIVLRELRPFFGGAEVLGEPLA
jgi:hypothetical protein